MNTFFLFPSFKFYPCFLFAAILLSINWLHAQDSERQNVIYFEYQLLGNIDKADRLPIEGLPHYSPQIQALDLTYKRRFWFSSKMGLSLDGHFGSAGRKLAFGSFKTGLGTTFFVGKKDRFFEFGLVGYKTIEKKRQKWQVADGTVLALSSGWRFETSNNSVILFGMRVHGFIRKMRSTEVFFGPYFGVGRAF